jgi:4-carboxymuconolactone decarboxylase
LARSRSVVKTTLHLNYAKEHGLTEAKHVEFITHLAFYVGRPKAMTTIIIANEAFELEKS